jgi:hypothetical protein
MGRRRQRSCDGGKRRVLGGNKRVGSQGAIKRGVESSQAALVAPVFVKKLHSKLCLVRRADSGQVVGIQAALQAERQQRLDVPGKKIEMGRKVFSDER